MNSSALPTIPTTQYCVVLHSYRPGSQDDASDHAISAKMNTHEKWTCILTPNRLPSPNVPDNVFLHCFELAGIYHMPRFRIIRRDRVSVKLTDPDVTSMTLSPSDSESAENNIKTWLKNT